MLTGRVMMRIRFERGSEITCAGPEIRFLSLESGSVLPRLAGTATAPPGPGAAGAPVGPWHVIGDDLVIGRQIDGAGVDFDAFPSGIFVRVGGDHLDGLVVDRHEGDAVEEERRLEKLEHIRRAHAHGVDADRRQAVDIDVADQVFAGILFVKIEDRADGHLLVIGGIGRNGVAVLRGRGPAEGQQQEGREEQPAALREKGGGHEEMPTAG
jgi:hypothetical protein